LLKIEITLVGSNVGTGAPGKALKVVAATTRGLLAAKFPVASLQTTEKL